MKVSSYKNSFQTQYEAHESLLIRKTNYELNGEEEIITFMNADDNIIGQLQNAAILIKTPNAFGGSINYLKNAFMEYAYNSQYGITVSYDNSCFFVPNWETGIVCYSIDTGEKKWKNRIGKIRRIFAHKKLDYILCERADTGIVKIDIKSGAVKEICKFHGDCYRITEDTIVIIEEFYRKKIVSTFNIPSFVKQYVKNVDAPENEIVNNVEYTNNIVEIRNWGNETIDSFQLN